MTLSGLSPGTNYHLIAKTYDDRTPPNWSAAREEIAVTTSGGALLPEEVCEVWASLNDWEDAVDLDVSGNKVYAFTDGIPGIASRAVSDISVFRLDTDIAVSKSGNLWAGVKLKSPITSQEKMFHLQIIADGTISPASSLL